jgi:hypothetical protein
LLFIIRGKDKERHREKHHGKVEGKIGMMHLHEKDCPKFLETTRD